MAEHYASGNWHVQEGKEDEFITRWTEFLEWTRKDHPALESARLIRDAGDLRHFISFAMWKDPDARAAWKESSGFAQRMGACRQLCDEFYGSDYESAVVI